MKSAKRFFLKMTLLMGICFSTLYGYDYCNYYCTNPNPLGTGFMIGVYGTFQTVYFNSRDRFTESTDNDRVLFRYDSIQKAPGGGAFASYGCGFCDRFVAAIRVDGLGLAESAHHNFREGAETAEIEDSTLHKMGLRWAVDLSFQPGFLVGNCLLAYFKVGGTLGGVEEEAWIKDNAPPFEVLDKAKKYHHPGGYVLGAGANIALMNCFSFFVEYDWRSYTSHLSSLSTRTDDFSVDSRITTLHSSAFTFGITMQF